MEHYIQLSKKLKVLGDANRLKILDLLSCGELCACEILEHFDFTQPTLSHHMKVLMDCGLVTARKEGLWNYYSLCPESCQSLMGNLSNILLNSENCLCHQEIDDIQCK